MPTGTVATSARKYHHDVVHYLSRRISFSDGATAVLPLGTIPAGALVVRGGVAVTTAFNAGTANTLNLGPAADDDGFGTLLALGTIGVIPTDEMATTNDAWVTADTVIQATLGLTGTAATAGAGIVWIEYIIADRTL
jgi:hypothetical protein